MADQTPAQTNIADYTWTQEPIKGYLVDEQQPDERLEFQYNPNNIADQKDANYGVLVVPGMSHPRYQYISGGARKIQFSLSFYSGDVMGQVAWIQSFLYPEHEGTMMKQAPHRMLLFFGELYKGVPCVVRDVKAVFHSLFDPQTLTPKRADVELMLEEYVTSSVNASTIRLGRVPITPRTRMV